MTYNAALLKAELTEDEGRHRRRYRCPAGKWTIGIGHNLEGKQFRAATWVAIKQDHPHLANALLDDHLVLSIGLIDRIYDEDIADAIVDLDTIWIGWRGLSDARQRALVNLSFQMGRVTLLGFVRFWRALKAHNFDHAADELIDSDWFKQTQASRTSRVVRQIRTGT